MRRAVTNPPRSRESRGALVQLCLSAFEAPRSSSSERLQLPVDVARNTVKLCSSLLDRKDDASAKDRHFTLRLLAHALSDSQLRDAGSIPQQLDSLARVDNLHGCALCLSCLVRLSESSVGLRSAASSVVEGVLAAVQCVGDTLRGGGIASERGDLRAPDLRDADMLLSSLHVILPEIKVPLEASAITVLNNLQPCAVVGASYVKQRASGTRGVEVLAPTTPESDRGGVVIDIWDTGESSKPSVLASHCRVSALRGFWQLFKLYPKTFFGRWGMVLNFEGHGRTLGASSLPTLLAICEMDPSAKVRSSALTALGALLEAPSVRNWPVPLETVSTRPARNTEPNFTSFAAQLVTTLHQSHTLVFRLLRNPHGDPQGALWACSSLITSTPYTKLRPGLLTQAVQHTMVHLRTLSHLQSLDNVPPSVMVTITVLNAALKRDDCRQELETCLYSLKAPYHSRNHPAGSTPPLTADEILTLALHVANLSRSRDTAILLALRRSGRAPVTDESASSVDTGEAPVALDFMALVGRVLHLRPLAISNNTRELAQSVIEDLVDQPGTGLRIRAHRLLQDLVQATPKVAGVSGGGVLGGGAHADADVGWCTKIAHRVLAAMPQESSALVRTAALTALPSVLLVAVGKCSGEAVTLQAYAFTMVHSGVRDANSAVRVGAAQACGSLVSLWKIRGGGGTASNGVFWPAVELMIGCFADEAGDVRSAAVTAVANFAAVALLTPEELVGDFADTGGSGGGLLTLHTLQGSIWHAAIQGALVLCRDQSDKARGAAFRAVGCLVEAIDLSHGTSPGAESSDGEPFVMPPGLESVPPGLEHVMDDRVRSCGLQSVKRPTCQHLVILIVETLAWGAGAAPPKCQWNACRAIGQLYHNSSFLLLPQLAEVHTTLVTSLVEQMEQAGNMKVRIQAAQALTQLPKQEVFWSPHHETMILRGVRGALAALEGSSTETAVEAKQRAVYTQALQTELIGLGDLWLSREGPSCLELQKQLQDAVPELLTLMHSVTEGTEGQKVSGSAVGIGGEFSQ